MHSPPRGGSVDPRDIITPDAFRVADRLIGTPLATPWRRAVAMLIDLVCVGILAIFLEAPVLLPAGLGAFLIYRVSRGRSDRWWTRVFRRGMGCFGAILVFVAVVALWDALFDREPDRSDPAVAEVDADGAFDLNLRSAVSILASGRELRAATSDSARERAARHAVRRLHERGLGASALRELAREAASAAAEDDVPLMPAEAWRAVGVAATALADSLDPAGALPADTVAQVDTAEAGQVTASPDPAGTRADTIALDTLPTDTAGTDTLAADTLPTDTAAHRVVILEDRLAELEQELDDARDRARDAEDRLDDDRGPIRTVVAVLADDLGVGLGWLGLYFTAFLVLGRGQTPGKRLTRIRVIRLDATPIGWWIALQRFGGYSASFFTGLLGFLEIFWDANRQGLQDKLVHTVVVDERPKQEAGLTSAPG